MSFGKKLRALREAKSMTQKELGQILNLSERVIGHYETDERFPRGGDKLKEIADFFNVSVDYLLGRTEEEEFSDNIIAFNTLDVDGLDDSEIEALKTIIETMKAKHKK